MLQQVVGRIERPNISGASNGESGAPKPEPGPSKGER
jgi:hypothetical protein